MFQKSLYMRCALRRIQVFAAELCFGEKLKLKNLLQVHLSQKKSTKKYVFILHKAEHKFLYLKHVR